MRVPWSIFAGDPYWVPPLRLERLEALSAKQPVFQHLDWQAWVAYRDGLPVGRVSAQIDRLHLERHSDDTGFFGFLDAQDDDEIFAALLGTAEAWLAERGMRRLLGPFSLNINQELGLLIEGFDTPPYFMMGHARPYYREAVERLGYDKAVDFFAYLISTRSAPPEYLKSLLKRLQRKISIRPLHRKRLAAEIDIIRDIFNDAWSENWGFVPFTKSEFDAVGREMMMIVPDDFVQIAEIDGEPVAFLVLLPNLNEVIADLDGRLLPLGWAKLLWRLKVKFPQTGRLPLMGVRKALHNTRFGPGLALAVVNAVREAAVSRGLEWVEMSWILEDNQAMLHLAEALGGYASKRYRMYQRPLP